MRGARRRRRHGRIGDDLTACCTPGASGVYRPVAEPDDIELQSTPLKSPPTAPPMPSVPIYTAPIPQARTRTPPGAPLPPLPKVTTVQVHGQLPYSNVTRAVSMERRRLLDPDPEGQLDAITERDERNEE